jgi:hypothetical protein
MHMKKLRTQDLDFRGWSWFYRIAYLALCSAVWVFLMVKDRSISLYLLVLIELMFLPFVVHQFWKAFKKKKK